MLFLPLSNIIAEVLSKAVQNIFCNFSKYFFLFMFKIFFWIAKNSFFSKLFHDVLILGICFEYL